MKRIIDSVFIALLCLLAFALGVLLPNLAHAQSTPVGQIASPGRLWHRVDALVLIDPHERRSEAISQWPLTAESVGTMLAQPIQPSRVGIIGAATVLKLKW